MKNNNANKKVKNAEVSASTGTQNKESMREGTFTLPTLQEAQNQYDNIGAYNQLQDNDESRAEVICQILYRKGQQAMCLD